MGRRIKVRVVAQAALCVVAWFQLFVWAEGASEGANPVMTCIDDAACEGGQEVGPPPLEGGSDACTPPSCVAPFCGSFTDPCSGNRVDCSGDCTPLSQECDPTNMMCCTPSFSCPPGSCGFVTDNCQVSQPCTCSNPGDTCLGSTCVSADAGADGGDPCAACCSTCNPQASNCSMCVGICGPSCNNCAATVTCVPPDAGGPVGDSGSPRDAAGSGDGSSPPPLVDSGGPTNADAQPGNNGAGVASVSGCGCRLARDEGGSRATAWMAAFGLALALRRRRARRAAPTP